VRKINNGLRGCKYEPDNLWNSCCGRGVEDLWKEYRASLGEENGCADKDGEAEASVDTPEPTANNAQESDALDDSGSEQSLQGSTTEGYSKLRQKARRGGNMYVPIRPGTRS
jgi:hypothetical protein